MAFTPNDRFQVVETAILAPGCCSICKGSRGPFVDTAVNDPWNGHVYYLCFQCLKSIYAALPEFFSNEVVKTEVVELSDEEVYARAKREIMAAIHGTLDSLNPDSGAPADFPADLPDFSVQGISEDSEGELGSTDRTSKTAGQDDRPAKRSGRNGVSGNSGSKSSGGLLDLNIP